MDSVWVGDKTMARTVKQRLVTSNLATHHRISMTHCLPSSLLDLCVCQNVYPSMYGGTFTIPIAFPLTLRQVQTCIDSIPLAQAHWHRKWWFRIDRGESIPQKLFQGTLLFIGRWRMIIVTVIDWFSSRAYWCRDWSRLQATGNYLLSCWQLPFVLLLSGEPDISDSFQIRHR